MADPGQRVLVTGAGSGLGLETALVLAGRGYRVAGAVLTEAEAAALGAASRDRHVPVDVLRMDVTRPDEVRSAVDSLADAGPVSALVHFAGVGLRGFCEDLSLEEVRQVFEVNLFGTLTLTQAVLPHMRQQRCGRIILTSSVAGRMGSMSIGGYASSKFAVEGFGECLAAEVRPFGIFVSLLEPGLIPTPHFGNHRNRARRAVDPSSPYYAWFCQHEHIVDGILARTALTPAHVAAKVRRILSARRPRLRYVVGRRAGLILGLRRYTPGEWFDRVYGAILRRLVTAPRVQATRLGNVP